MPEGVGPARRRERPPVGKRRGTGTVELLGAASGTCWEFAGVRRKRAGFGVGFPAFDALLLWGDKHGPHGNKPSAGLLVGALSTF